MIYAHKTCWKHHTAKKETPWGHEIVWAALTGVHGKLIFIKKNHSTSLKFFDRKDEVIFVRRGRIKINWGDSSFVKEQFPEEYFENVLKQGDSFCVQAGCPYRITALSNAEIIEIGSCSNSSFTRLYDDYGRDVDG